MTLEFTKMHALGNDFAVIDAVRQAVELTPDVIMQMADRHRGIGFDQLLVVQPASSSDIDFDYRIYNADGGEVGQCGNGARCLARFIHDNGLSDQSALTVATPTCRMQLQLRDDGQVAVSLGVPQLAQQSAQQVDVAGQPISFVAVNVGNPHAVITVESAADADVGGVGAQLTRHALFPDGVNVGFMEIAEPERINLRVFERGVGETQACGSGACAAVVAGRVMGELAENVVVTLPGGELQVSWQGAGEPVWLIGPATTVYRGTWG